MAGRIYLLNGSSALVPMEEAPYDSESLLQELLARHPDLLAGEQIDSDQPRRWLLVTREMSVPDQQDGAGRWSLDHLFLDQDAIPTLVEVKRSSDTRIRREVIGQMLDYAANAVAYLPIDQIQGRFESRCERDGSIPAEELAALLGDSSDGTDFWQRVKTNLQAGRIRMVFIADEIPSELRRLVEFLNEQMDPAEVLAIEIKQFVGEGVKTLVPRVLGQTESARQKKSTSFKADSIAEAEFLARFDAARPPAEQAVARRLIAWAPSRGLKDCFTENQRSVAFIPPVVQGDVRAWPMSLRSDGMVTIQMRNLKFKPPFDAETKRDELLDRLRPLPGLRLTQLSREGFPAIPIASLTDPKVLDSFVATLDWVVEQLRTANG